MSEQRHLPPPERSELTLGYLRLTDSAPLILALESGLFRHYGLEVALQREVSWANLRDRLVAGNLDAAQILAPLPLATALGLGGLRAEVITGLALSLNGNAITVSPALAAAIAEEGGDLLRGARHTAQALGNWLRRGSRPVLTFAAAHTFSCHIFQLRLWLQAGGIDPERDVRIIVLPPEQMVDSLARGVIDGYCVGEPWNSVAVQRGVGAVQATGYEVWNNGVEKVLGVMERWHQRHPATHLRLRLALMQACMRLADPQSRCEVAALLASSAYLDMPERALLPSLSGKFVFARGQAPVELPHFHVFGRFQAGFPWRSHGEWLLRQCGAMLGRDLPPEDVKALVQRCFRTDLYREAARQLDLPCPSRDYKPDNTHHTPWEMEPGIELGPDRHL